MKRLTQAIAVAIGSGQLKANDHLAWVSLSP